MRLLLIFIFSFSAVVEAQWGTGQFGGSFCPTPFGPGRGAVNGGDELMNLTGQLAARNQRVKVLEDQQDRVNEDLRKAKQDMAEVLTSGAIAAIKEHREHRNSRTSYQSDCSSRESASAGTSATDVADWPGEARGGDPSNDRNRRPPPAAFCQAGRNAWDRYFVEDDGTVNPSVCDHNIPGITKARAGRDRREICREGLDRYYELMEKKQRLREDISRLDKQARAYERRLERVRDEITEGTYCPWCNSKRRGYANLGAGNSLMQGAGIMAMLAMSMGGQQRRPMMPPMMPPRPPPYMSPYGSPFGAPMARYGGPGFPVNPYQARPMPGYMGMGPAIPGGRPMYGAMPGAIGQGGFGCQGANPLAMGQPFGSPGVNPIFGGASPFNNPHAYNPIASMFNPGGGPGWGFPQYGSGIPGFSDMDGFGGGSPFGSPFGGGDPFAPGMMPFMGQQGNPFFQSPYAFNPYDPYGSNPFMNQFGGYNPYGPMSPWGPGNPYAGGYPYAPGMMPYMGGNPWGGGPFGNPFSPGYGGGGAPGVLPPGGIPNYGFQSPWGAPLGSPVANFFNQINSLNNQIQYIQNGSYYGNGGWGAGAPGIIPPRGGPGGGGGGFGAPRPPAVLPAPIR